MNDPVEIALEIRDKISELPETKEYLRLKEIIDNDEEIQTLQKEIISLQNADKKEEAKELSNKLNSMPIIIDFQIVKEQLADTLRLVSDILK